MNDTPERANGFYWFQDTSNQYSQRILKVIDEARADNVPDFRMLDFLDAIGNQIRPPKPQSLWKRVLSLDSNVRLHK